MKSSLFKRIVIITIIISIVFTIYITYPKSSLLYEILPNTLREQQFNYLIIWKDNSYKIINDIDKINDYLSYIKQLKLSKYFRKVSRDNNTLYVISVYNTKASSDDSITIIIKNKNFIEVYLKTHGRKFSENYKTINSTIDMNYIDNLYTSN